MSSISPLFTVPFLITIAVMLWVAVASARRVRTAGDFSLAGRRAGGLNVAGGILGTLVGGAATIGTAQLAYLHGLSAWWFTLGAGIACLFLGLGLAPTLRGGMVATIPQFISRYHGQRARVCASLFSALGMFIHIVAQLLAGGALLSTLFDLSLAGGALIALLLTALFTVGGGMRSAGPLGVVKTTLIYAIMLAGGMMVVAGGGLAELERALPPFPWFSLFGCGVSNGISDLCSLLVGVVSTQTYLQSIFSARDTAAARNGALISALLMPPLGLLGIVIGMYMRVHAPGIDSAKALPLFLAGHFHPALAGVAFAALLVAAVGTAAGLAMGVGTTLYVDVVAKLIRGADHELALMRLLTLGALVASFGVLISDPDSAIMKWSFLSMGLRGATLFLPLLLAIFLGERTSARGGALSIYAAPTAVIIAGALSSPLPPLYVGLAVSLGAMLLGFVWRRQGPGARN